MKFKFTGDTYTYHDPLTNREIEIVSEQEYDAAIHVDGPQIIINGQPQIHPDSTIWITIDDIQIPYAVQCFNRQWHQI